MTGEIDQKPGNCAQKHAKRVLTNNPGKTTHENPAGVETDDDPGKFQDL
jgi:hypothetical protein